MMDFGVGLAWVAISAVSLKWLAALGRASAREHHETGLPLGDGELGYEELYPHELFPLPAGVSR